MRLTREAGTTRAALGAVPQAPPVPEPNSTDARIVDLNTAYDAAVSGDSSPTPAPGTGLYYLKAWINDSPPHPAYSNTYAHQLIQQLEDWAASVTAATPASAPSTAVTATTNPATGLTTFATPSATAGGLALLGLPWYVWAGGAAVLAVALT